MGWSRTRHEQGEFYIDYKFEGEHFYKDDNSVDEISLETFVDEKIAEIQNFGDLEYLDYEFDDDVILHFIERVAVTITEYGGYEPIDVDYELNGDRKPKGCKEVSVVCYSIE